MTGAIIGFLLNLDFVLIPIVAVLTALRIYPRWMVTPDDPVSPFGLNEPAVQKIYGVAGHVMLHDGRWWVDVGFDPGRFRRWLGDFYFLGWRNRGYGIAYYFKPKELYPDPTTLNYWHMLRSESHRGRVSRYEAEGFWMYSIRLFNLMGHPKGIQVGYKVETIVKDPGGRRSYVNMEGRPICTFRGLD